MPIYEFRCDSCGNKFDKLCPMGETGENINCPRCEAPKPQRVMSGFAPKSVGKNGLSTPMGGGGGCSGCSSSSCSTCGH
ncbi:hypothetical protein DCCM_2365 [Desulfocucumis palustris]|uniref:Putative regulatory protein FmdB zinc ribbon domain-containing protein n=1 Tax=Desulfocucumis palustris TaxID=1898651 RepID=A0A2L2XGB3_9FIRM|nr:zinc ribbon domain-containing protein [Desulfocucumis palustris]GBF33266.1 hypothetical protein DCCM_2365 [Desulfocucumis palustris]